MESLSLKTLETLLLVNPSTQASTSMEPDYTCNYREDVWNTLLKQDAEKPQIHLQSPQLEFRGTLVEQLRGVTKKLGLSIGTLHTAVAQLDLFMDAHRLRVDRLTQIALACLSVAAKSEEKKGGAPTLKTLSKVSGTEICPRTFTQLEWMVGQHVRWKLLAPTPVTFATWLSQYLVTDEDLVSRNQKLVRQLKKDGAKLLNAYLDLTLSDVRLKVVDAADVGSACISCARADLGFCAWPPALAAAAGRQHSVVASIARRLNRMMEMLKSRGSVVESELDQGYSSAQRSPEPSPSSQVTTTPPTPSSAPHSDINSNVMDSADNNRYVRSHALINACFNKDQPYTNKPTKRTIHMDEELDAVAPRKKFQQMNPVPEVIL